MNRRPDRIGKYPVIAEAGRGSSAIVYLADDPFNNRRVAIKVAHDDSGRDDEEAARFEKLFLNEASLAGKLNHVNIVNVYDAVVEGDVRYIVMEYVNGGSLRRYCTGDSLLPMRQVALMIFKCCRALDYAYRAGIIHRDIKPANILLTEQGEVKLSDFGTAKILHATHTQLDGFLGSPAYMSPEMINEHPASVQGDIYSLGVVLYEMLTGRLPYQADNSITMINKILREEPTPVESVRTDVPVALSRIVRKAMTKDLSQRYTAWFDFARDLVDCFPQLEALGVEITAAEKFTRLRALEFFRDFRDAELREVIRASRWERRNRSETLVEERDAGDAMYVIVNGEVKVSRAGQFIGALRAGDCFGEHSLFGKRNRQQMLTLSAVSPVEYIRIQENMLEQVSDGCQLRFTKQFLHILIGRLTAGQQAG